MDENRRRVVQTLGLTALGGLAGCQETTSRTDTDATTSEQPPASETTTTGTGTAESTTAEPTVTVQTAVTNGESTPVVEVSGSATAGSPIVEVEISVGDQRKTAAVEEAASVSFEQSFQVQGGQRYDVGVRVETTDAAHTAEARTEYVSLPVDGIETDRLVGAHYYPWYEMSAGHDGWTDKCVAEPVLGEYAADSEAVIDQHLTWCLDHGIDWLSVSWWGEDSGSDEALANGLLEAEKFDRLSFSILYETTRLEQYDYDLDDEAARAHLERDFQYLEDEFFSEDNYLEFDGRPVVFFWIAHALRGDAEAAFDEITAAIDTDVYVLAGLPFGQSLGTAPMSAVADGVTSYNPYSPRTDIEDVFHDTYREGLRTMNLSTRAADVDFFPVVIPGFNDTAIPDTQREDNPVLSASPERYERVCEQVSPHLADSEAVLVTSFNEWYENTQIEPSEQYGTAYLETTAQRLATGESEGYDPTGRTLRLAFDETFVPTEVNPDSTDTRELAFMAYELEIHAGDERLAAFDIGTPTEEPLFLAGAFPPASNDQKTWRWFGGQAAEASLFIPGALEGADRAVLRGQPMQSGEISATVYFDGERTDEVDFGVREPQTYELEL